MDENKINVEQTDVDKSQENINEYSLNNSNSTLSISFGIKIVKLKKISCCPILFCTVYYGNTNEIKNRCNPIPSKYFWQNLRKLSDCFDKNVVCEGHEKENYCVDQSTNNYNRYFLHNVIRCILKLNLIPSDVKFCHFDKQNINPNILSEEVNIHSHPKTHYCNKHCYLELDSPKILES